VLLTEATLSDFEAQLNAALQGVDAIEKTEEIYTWNFSPTEAIRCGESQLVEYLLSDDTNWDQSILALLKAEDTETKASGKQGHKNGEAKVTSSPPSVVSAGSRNLN